MSKIIWRRDEAEIRKSFEVQPKAPWDWLKRDLITFEAFGKLGSPENEGSDYFTLSRFTNQDAQDLGTILYNRLTTLSAITADGITVSIYFANNTHCVFSRTTGTKLNAQSADLALQKARTVLRFGYSTLYLQALQKIFDRAPSWLTSLTDEYTTVGGGVPIMVDGVDSIVAVVVVQGITSAHQRPGPRGGTPIEGLFDHDAIVSALFDHWNDEQI